MSRPSLRATAIVAAVLMFAGTFAFSFLFAGHDPAPHGVDVGVVGSSGAIKGVARTAEASGSGAFDLRRYASVDAARRAIEDREIYGAVVQDPAGRRLLVASGASAMVASLLEARFAPTAVQDVRPLAGGDPRGTSLNLLLLPLMIGSILVPTALKGAVPEITGLRKLGFLALFAAAGGLGLAGLAHALDAMPGSYWGLAGLVALTILAVSSMVAAIESSPLGIAGAFVGILVFLVLGIPASGAASAPELLPGFWHAVGQFLPAGAGARAIRNTAYFDGAAVLQPLLVLSAFALAGASLVLAAHRRVAHRLTREPAAAGDDLLASRPVPVAA